MAFPVVSSCVVVQRHTLIHANGGDALPDWQQTSRPGVAKPPLFVSGWLVASRVVLFLNIGFWSVRYD